VDEQRRPCGALKEEGDEGAAATPAVVVVPASAAEYDFDSPEEQAERPLSPSTRPAEGVQRGSREEGSTMAETSKTEGSTMVETSAEVQAASPTSSSVGGGCLGGGGGATASPMLSTATGGRGAGSGEPNLR